VALGAVDPHHPVAGVVVGLLEFVFDGRDLDLEADPLQVISDGVNVRRQLTVQTQQREHPDLIRDPEPTWKAQPDILAWLESL
jgi:hypothetical protein